MIEAILLFLVLFNLLSAIAVLCALADEIEFGKCRGAYYKHITISTFCLPVIIFKDFLEDYNVIGSLILSLLLLALYPGAVVAGIWLLIVVSICDTFNMLFKRKNK